MRYRALSASGDYTFGQSSANFLVNSPATVAQAVLTRLKLMTGEWFLDVTTGTPYREKILGAHRLATADPTIRARILGTPGVEGLESYFSSYDPATRKLNVSATINTIYGQTDLTAAL